MKLTAFWTNSALELVLPATAIKRRIRQDVFVTRTTTFCLENAVSL